MERFESLWDNSRGDSHPSLPCLAEAPSEVEGAVRSERSPAFNGMDEDENEPDRRGRPDREVFPETRKSRSHYGKRGIRFRVTGRNGGTVKFLAWYLVVLLLVLCAATSAQSRNNWPHPPAPADKSTTTSQTPSTAVGPRVDSVQLQREAKELLELSQSLQPDMESVNHGLLPKDIIEKLKRIEKLSKHLRGELAVR